MMQSKIKKEKLLNIKLFHMDATNMKFKDECFDKILLSLVLHEIDEGLTVVEEIHCDYSKVLRLKKWIGGQ